MDAVITYVNSSDIEWQKQYHSVSDFINEKRYRDWGTLKYVLRGIEQCMPYIKNVFLVVSAQSQIPFYVNTDKIKVIYHKDIIPEEFLPTFNSNTIETFLHRIPGLSEEFVYFNDDMIPKRYMPEGVFFENGKPCYMKNPYDISIDTQLNTIFYNVLKTCNCLAKVSCGVKNFVGNFDIFYTQHTGTPFLKSKCEECYNKIETIINTKLTKTRKGDNPSQFLYSAYNFYNGDCVIKDISYGFVSIGDDRYGVDYICDVIKNEKYTSVCINDHSSGLSDDEISFYKKEITESLEKILPNKSIYEN